MKKSEDLGQYLIEVFKDYLGTEQEKLLHNDDFVVEKLTNKYGVETFESKFKKYAPSVWDDAWDFFNRECGAI